MTTKIAFINQKGGVGKTTLSANCGAFWGMERRVLAIDLDPQANLSLHYGVGEEAAEKNIYRAIRGDFPMREAVVEVTDSLHLVPSHIDLSAAEWEFGQEVGREVILKELLDTYLQSHPYDVVIVDCPPSLGFLSLNALAAVDDVVIPVQAEFFALQGMAQLLRVLELVQKRLHPKLQWRAIVPTLVDVRTNLGREVIEELQEHFTEKVTRTFISKRVKIAEAPSFGQSIFDYAPDSDCCREFADLGRELEERLGMQTTAARGPAPGTPAAEGPAHASPKNPSAVDPSSAVGGGTVAADAVDPRAGHDPARSSAEPAPAQSGTAGNPPSSVVEPRPEVESA